MADRSADWLAQAQRDLRHAENACKSEDYEWSCFSAQQAAEKAVKAVYLHLHGEGWGHSTFKLLQGLKDQCSVPAPLIDAARSLDKHYIPSRYPNGFDQGIPGDYYTEKDAKEAIDHARGIIKFCADVLCQ